MCHLCSTKPVYEFTNKRKLCKKCYIRWFEKKVLYTIRKFGMLEGGDVIGYSKKSDVRSVVLEKILKMISERGLVKITTGRGFGKFAVPTTIDLQAYEIVGKIVKGNVEDLKKKNKKVITPLILFLDKEVELYARLKKLKFEKRKEKRGKILEFINELEKKHPEVKRAVVNCFQED
jgi:hypothetical protein